MVFKKKVLLLVIGCILCLCSIAYVTLQNQKIASVYISHMTSDKSMYNPAEQVTLSITLKNNSDIEFKKGKVQIQAFALDKEIGDPASLDISMDKDNEKTIKMTWQAPDKDFTGYLLKVDLLAKNKVIDTQTIGVDISSSWVKFPRYGYVYDFEKEVDVEGKIDMMTRYHINAIEYYDWHYRHHQPLSPDVTKDDKGVWEDWAGRKIYGDTIAGYIEEAKQSNMVNMAYNMIYAGTDDFFKNTEGIKEDPNNWKLFFKTGSNRGAGQFKFRMGTSPSGNGNLYFVNPLNPAWQEHIFREENKIFDVLDFDGWHGDTVGDWGDMMTFDGQPLGYSEEGTPIYSVLNTYTPFLNAAKDALGDKYLSFNPVGAQGIEYANKSKADVLYAEFWPWDKDRNGNSYSTYRALVEEIERATEESKPYSIDGKGKSLVVKAYINYDVKLGIMNDPAVLLCDAAVYAAGGSRLEIGNGDHMLHVEYYPNDHVLMSDKLKKDMKNMGDFIVAYENLLRDGQETTSNDVIIQNYSYSKTGKSDAIWTYTRKDQDYEILHLINLLGTGNQWKDTKGRKAEPKSAEAIHLKYYTTEDIKTVNLASPDFNDCQTSQIPFTKGNDDRGVYIELTVPYLEYWDMIYMSYK